MSGICGVIGIEPAGHAEAITRRMMAALRHPGPDEERSFLAPSAAARQARFFVARDQLGIKPLYCSSSVGADGESSRRS